MNTKVQIREGRSLNVDVILNPRSDVTLFLIHGLGGRGQQFRGQIPALSEKFSLIIPDLPGLGKSDRPFVSDTNPYSFYELSLDLKILFEKFSAEKNYLIGHSYGGALAVKLALDHQEKIQRLILIDPTCCDGKFQLPAIFKMPLFFLTLFRFMLENNFKKNAFDVSSDPQLIKEETEISRLNRMDVIKGMLNGMREMPEINIKKLLTPTLILIGENDRIIPPSVIQQFYQALPNHQFTLIQHAAHMMMLEKPLLVNQLINNFLA